MRILCRISRRDETTSIPTLAYGTWPDSRLVIGPFDYRQPRLRMRGFALNMRFISNLSPSAADPHPFSMMEVPAHIVPVLTGTAPIAMHVSAMPARDHSMSLRIVLLRLVRHRGNG